MPKVSLVYPRELFLIAVGQDPHYHSWHDQLKGPREEDGELGEMTGLCTVQQNGNRLGALLQVVLQNFMDQPGCSASATFALESELKQV